MAFTSALLIGGAALAAAGATAGAIGSSVNNRKAQEERSRMYHQSKNFLNAEYYRDPLSSTSNRALLKTMDQRLRDQNDALQNRAVAGGATMENQLAARKANNETMSNVYSNLLMGEDARRQQINQQKLQLEQQYSQGQQMSYLQSAQNWQAWGAQMAQAGMSLASSGLLSGAGGVAGAAGAAGAASGASGANVSQILAQNKAYLNGLKAGGVDFSKWGGAAGIAANILAG